MLAIALSATVHGVEPLEVRVEVSLQAGLPAFTVVGLPQGAVREGRERVAAALRHTGLGLPQRKITVNLAPGDVPKDGTALDLPIAVGIVAAAGALPCHHLADVGLVGEMGLDGVLRPVRGVLAMAHRFRELGLAGCIVPRENASEAAVLDGLHVFPASTLRDVIEHLSGAHRIDPVRVDPVALLRAPGSPGPSLADVRGQELAKRALVLAAAGSHHLLLVGPPGAGKTMLARRLPGILPPPTLDEALETTRVHSVAGLLAPGEALVASRPFRAPHHTVSDAGLVGGGRPVRPGEVSLAHNGVLFLDELAEFRRNVLDSLRQPLEDGHVRISRAAGSIRFPARVLLVAAMNPCPCGHHGDGTDRCLCDPSLVRRYQGRVSGPLRDRFDLQVAVSAVEPAALHAAPGADRRHEARECVTRARAAQVERFRDEAHVHANGQMTPALLRRHCRVEGEAARLLSHAVRRLGLSARGHDRVLRVARTIADLEGCTALADHHVAEAIQFRLG